MGQHKSTPEAPVASWCGSGQRSGPETPPHHLSLKPIANVIDPVPGVTWPTEQTLNDDIVPYFQPSDQPPARRVDMDQRRAASAGGLPETGPDQQHQGEDLIQESTLGPVTL